jgi:hypothetical protein
MAKVVDIYINEVIEREETKLEAQERAKLNDQYLAGKAAESSKKETKAALLDRLGITADEAALLLS